MTIQTEPYRVTRMFFDYCNAAADPVDRQRFEVAIEHSITIASPRMTRRAMWFTIAGSNNAVP